METLFFQILKPMHYPDASLALTPHINPAGYPICSTFKISPEIWQLITSPTATSLVQATITSPLAHGNNPLADLSGHLSPLPSALFSTQQPEGSSEHRIQIMSLTCSKLSGTLPPKGLLHNSSLHLNFSASRELHSLLPRSFLLLPSRWAFYD